MKDDNKTKRQLVYELTELRLQNADKISDKHVAEKARRYAESIVETVRESLLVLDSDLRIISANPYFYKTFNGTSSETVGSLIYDLGNKQWDIPRLRELLEEILPEKQALSDFEVTHNFQDIGYKVMLLNARQIYQNDIGTQMILLAIEDITERKRLEDLLTEDEGRYRRVFETASEGILFLEQREGKITHANSAFVKMLGYTKEEIIGNKLQDIGILLDMGDIQTTLQRLVKSGISNYDDVPVRTKSGQHIDTDIYLANRARLIQCNILDISRRKRVGEALQESEDRYRLLFEGAQDGMALADLETGKIEDCNPALCGMVEKDKTELIGQHQRILHPQQHLKNGHSFSYRLHKIGDLGQTLKDNLLSKSGKIIPVEVRASKIHLDNRDYLLGIFRDITERKQAEETLRQTLENLRKAISTTIQVIISTVEARDPYTASHQVRVANLARAIATEMELSQDRIEGIWIAASIHDLGKLFVPAEILSKPGKITDNEFCLIKEHPKKGYEILKNVESSWPLAEVVYQHHERMDGSGYPRNLKGDEILMEARILAVCDVVESMASHRPYRAALGIEAALKEIEENRGILYDADAVDVCLRLFREKGFTLEKTLL